MTLQGRLRVGLLIVVVYLAPLPCDYKRLQKDEQALPLVPVCRWASYQTTPFTILYLK